MQKEYSRKGKEDKPVLAICYDFDKTLSPTDMQAQGYIQAVGFDIPGFWKASNELAENNDMDQNLAYMFKMFLEAEGNIVFTKKALEEYGAQVALFPGVEEWFDRIKDYGNQYGVLIEHYIISSGLKEMIEGTTVAKAGAFERVYASSFYFNERGVAKWPAQVVNYTNKTQFLFRIEKGVLDINDPGVNEYFAPEEIRVPFRNMIYIGDSDTDIPCMKLVNANGGYSIGVYNAESKDKNKVYQMMRDERIKYFAPADYTEGSELDFLVKAIIERTAKNEVLENFNYKCKAESIQAFKESNEEERDKIEGMIALENSGSFAQTHTIIGKLRVYTDWSLEEKERLCKTALSNSQVKYILTDTDVAAFYTLLLKHVKSLSEAMIEVKSILEDKE